MAAKKVVRVQPSQSSQGGQAGAPTWKPAPEAKSKATRLRVIAAVLWLLAIGTEAFSIFWFFWRNRQEHTFSTTNMVLLIAVIVAIGVVAVSGDLLWKWANRLDPASKADPIRFFVQNQLGAIIAIVAFLPLIAVILLNKNMNAQQKGIVGVIAAAALAVAVLAGITINPPSQEANAQQYPAESAVVVGYTGHDLVYWTKDGTVYHLCQQASAVNETSKDNTIYSGTVADAHVAGKDRLTLQVAQELKQCGLATPVPAGS